MTVKMGRYGGPTLKFRGVLHRNGAYISIEHGSLSIRGVQHCLAFRGLHKKTRESRPHSMPQRHCLDWTSDCK